MASLLNTRRGRPSKGPRHPFTVKLDMERAVKLAELLTILDVNGVAYLTPIVETHLDSIDLDHLRNDSRGRTTVVAAPGATPTSRTR